MRILIFLFLSFGVMAEDLSKTEKAGEVSFQVLNFIDMMQTIEIVQHSDK